jgi:hypothetical protein
MLAMNYQTAHCYIQTAAVCTVTAMRYHQLEVLGFSGVILDHVYGWVCRTILYRGKLKEFIHSCTAVRVLFCCMWPWLNTQNKLGVDGWWGVVPCLEDWVGCSTIKIVSISWMLKRTLDGLFVILQVIDLGSKIMGILIWKVFFSKIRR